MLMQFQRYSLQFLILVFFSVIIFGCSGSRSSLKLHRSIRENDFKKSEKLIRDIKNISIRDGHGNTPLHYAAAKNKYNELAKKMISSGSDINAVNSKGLSVLVIAIRANNLAIAKHLIEVGTDIDYGRDGITPLIEAVRNNQSDMVNFLISRGADINARDNSGETSLHKAAFNGNIDICKVLLNNNADVNIISQDDRLPLHVAVLYNNIDVIRLLLDSGSKISISTKSEKSLYSSAKLYKYLAENIYEDTEQSKNYFGKASFLFEHAAKKFSLRSEQLSKAINGEIAKEIFFTLLSGVAEAGQSYIAQQNRNRITEIAALKKTANSGGSFDDYIVYKNKLIDKQGSAPWQMQSSNNGKRINYSKINKLKNLKNLYNETAKSCKRMSVDCAEDGYLKSNINLENSDTLNSNDDFKKGDNQNAMSTLYVYRDGLPLADILVHIDGKSKFILPVSSVGMSKLTPGKHDLWAKIKMYGAEGWWTHFPITTEMSKDYFIEVDIPIKMMRSNFEPATSLKLINKKDAQVKIKGKKIVEEIFISEFTLFE